jgi:two-component system, OmpR family, KDP operon response regulator KdpE
MNDALPLVLVVEDEVEIRRFVRAALEEDGCRVGEAATAAQGIAQAVALKPAVILLDLGLPDGDGVNFISDLRSWSTVPVVVLSARSAEAEKIAALDAGADDYVTKPFGVGELLARVRAVLRRRPLVEGENAVFEFGDVCVDHARRVVTRASEPVHLTPIEYRLLSLMLMNAGRVMTHRQLLKEIWGPSHVESSHYLRIYVGNLRQKLEADPAQPKHILTETGVGYRFQT